MVFSSTIFLFFFLPIAVVGYFLIPTKGRNYWLLAVSLFFYYYGGAAFFPVIICSILLNYAGGLFIGLLQEAKKPQAEKIILIIAVTGNLAMLTYWKYIGFILQTIKDITGFSISVPDIILPIGISFFTFQGMSYVIDVHRGTVSVQKNILKVGLYIALFPQLIAGPIVRYSNIEKQISNRIHSVDNFADGIRVFVIGLAKKAVLANATAVTADAVFGLHPYQNEPAVAWLGLVSYFFQLYFDFSGYTDMAMGIGMMFGFTFPKNFDYPYISCSVSEIWRRWHMSLTGWFRDYVYIPLGGNRTGHTYRNLICIFVLTGIWHGASWNYLVWGVYWALLFIAERFLSDRIRFRLPAPMAWAITMTLWMIGLMIFRTKTLLLCGQYFLSLFGLCPVQDRGFSLAYYIGRYEVCMLLICAIAATPLGSYVYQFAKRKMPQTVFIMIENTAVLMLLVLSAIYVVTGTYNPFIYFQF